LTIPEKLLTKNMARIAPVDAMQVKRMLDGRCARQN
jgi:hypothetical protein